VPVLAVGYNDFGFRNGGKTHTPAINKLVAEGIDLKSYYGCTPQRAQKSLPFVPVSVPVAILASQPDRCPSFCA